MTVRGKHGKPKAGFPPFPPPLEIALRFPHSNSSDGQRKSAKPKAGFPLSLCSTTPFRETQKQTSGFPAMGNDNYGSVTFLPEATRQDFSIFADHPRLLERLRKRETEWTDWKEASRAQGRCAILCGTCQRCADRMTVRTFVERHATRRMFRRQYHLCFQ